MKSLFRSLALMIFVILPGTSAADVILPAVLADHMVIQQNAPIHIWGNADPGESVTVSFTAQKESTQANENGQWSIGLSPVTAGGPFDLSIQGKNTIVVKDILVGEVWVCSGQSNMQWMVRNSNNAEQEIAGADFPGIRLFTVKRSVANDPQTDVEGQWAACDSQTVKSFSAVGYYFGRRLFQSQNIPVGLILSAWGGTPAEAWTSHSTLEETSEFQPILDRFAVIVERFPAANKRFKENTEKWKVERAAARAAGNQPPRRPRAPRGPGHPHQPAGLYNAMIAPLTPLTIRGAIWYQGEANAGRAEQYRNLFSAMIQNWRESWDQGDFPFLFVQLANFRKIKPEPVNSDWAELREAQSLALSLPNTGMAVTIDIGQADNIHPRNKQDVGLRLALAAEANVYGEDQAYSGPIYQSMSVESKKIRIHFTHANKGLSTTDKEALKGFAISGPDSQFVWADASIDGKTVLVSHPTISNPIAVRYAWANNPVCNLYNGAGLPASPFRTDSWPGITTGKR